MNIPISLNIHKAPCFQVFAVVGRPSPAFRSRVLRLNAQLRENGQGESWLLRPYISAKSRRCHERTLPTILRYFTVLVDRQPRLHSDESSWLEALKI